MIDLTGIPLVEAQPEVQDFGGVLAPPLGGPVQRINRLGTRWTIGFETPMLPVEPNLRLWSGRLARAKVEGALIWVPEPELTYTGAATAGIYVPSSGGSALGIVGLIPGQPLVEGKWLSIIHDARRYLHRLTTTTTADGGGNSGVGIFPPLRTTLSATDVVELASPKMQGSLSGTAGWTIPMFAAPLTFTVSEDE